MTNEIGLSIQMGAREIRLANQVTGPITAQCLVPFAFPGDVVNWSVHARAARLGGGVGGRAREGLAVAGQEQTGVDGVERRQ